MRTLPIKLDGRTYLWNGSTWTDERFLRPPGKVGNLLMGRLVQTLRRTRHAKVDGDLVLSAAAACATDGDLETASELASRVLRIDPRHVGAATLMATLLRKQRQPREALRVTESFQRRRDAALLVVRAAASCDVGDWEAADKLVRRAIAIEKTNTRPETLRVLARVMSARARSAA